MPKAREYPRNPVPPATSVITFTNPDTDLTEHVLLEELGATAMFSQVTSDEVAFTINNRLSALENRQDTNRSVQVLNATAGVNVVDLLQGTIIHFASTAGAFSVEFVNVPAAVDVTISVAVTTNDHVMTIANSVWAQGVTAPVTADWDSGETMVITTSKLPNVETWFNEWRLVTTTATPAVVAPTFTAYYSTSASLTSPVALSGATLPAGEVAVWFQSSNPAVVESVRYFCNLSGAVPAIGAESDSYISRIYTSPFKMRGLYLNTTTGNFGVQDLWDTNVDPTAANRATYDKNGSTTLTIQAVLIDATVVEQTVTFNTNNDPIGATATSTHTATAYAGATSTHAVTIPDGVDRAVLVVASYSCSPYTGSSMILDSLTIGGNAMTEITAATKDVAESQGLGQFVAYATEASLSTGSMTIAPTFASAPGTYSSIIYDVFVFTNVATPAFGGDSDYANSAEATDQSLVPSVAAVPANSYLLTVGCQDYTNNPVMSVDLGTATTTVEVPTSPTIETRAFTVADSGASATEAATWTTRGRAVAAIVYLDYAASPGGPPVTPIIPAVPTISSTVAGTNQLTVTWGAAVDAVSYELRHGTTNPPANAPIVAASPYVISGLAASALRYVQVRSKSSTGDFSAWSTASSGTPTGTVTPPVVWDSTKYLVSYDHRDVMMGEGYGTPFFPDLYTQKGFVRVNSSTNEWELANIVRSDTVANALNRWEARTYARPFRDACGPRLVVTNRLGLDIYTRQSGSSIAGKAQSILEMAKSGSTGTINRTATWTTLANNINKLYYSASGTSYWGYDVVFLSISHENNGSWAFTYTGTNPQLIGRSEFTAAGGATAANYGTEMAAALIRVGQTGACDEVHRLSCEHVMDVLWSIQPKCIIGMTPAANGSSIPDGGTLTGLTDAWIESSFPRVSRGFGLDFVCPTLYWRNSTSVAYDGSGSVDDYMNYTNSDGWFENENSFINETYGCPTGLLEFGGAYAIPGEQTPGVGGAVSDAGMAAFLGRILELELSNAAGKAENGLAFINHWNFLNWVGSDGAIPGSTYGSFNIMEGCWGRHPLNVVHPGPRADSKPYFSSRSTPMYPKSLAYMQSQFSV